MPTNTWGKRVQLSSNTTGFSLKSQSPSLAPACIHNHQSAYACFTAPSFCLNTSEIIGGTKQKVFNIFYKLPTGFYCCRANAEMLSKRKSVKSFFLSYPKVDLYCHYIRRSFMSKRIFKVAKPTFSIQHSRRSQGPNRDR